MLRTARGMNMSITYTCVLPIALADVDFTQGSAAITTDLYLSQGEPMNEFRPTGITYTDTPDGSWPALKSIHFIYEREGVSAGLGGSHFRRFGVGHSARRRVRNTPVRWLLRKNKQS